MAATAINGIRHSKSGAKVGLVATWGCLDIQVGLSAGVGWRREAQHEKYPPINRLLIRKYSHTYLLMIPIYNAFPYIF